MGVARSGLVILVQGHFLVRSPGYLHTDSMVPSTAT